MKGNDYWQHQNQEQLEKYYPNLKNTQYTITSEDTIDYNCIAWAAEDNQTWWWPDASEQNYWPPNIPRRETLDAFIKAFQTLGYQRCNISSELEIDFQKIAIYGLDTRPTHMARQLNNGKWTSKIGNWEDIEHELEALEGNTYGKVIFMMKKLK